MICFLVFAVHVECRGDRFVSDLTTVAACCWSVICFRLLRVSFRRLRMVGANSDISASEIIWKWSQICRRRRSLVTMHCLSFFSSAWSSRCIHCGPFSPSFSDNPLHWENLVNEYCSGKFFHYVSLWCGSLNFVRRQSNRTAQRVKFDVHLRCFFLNSRNCSVNIIFSWMYILFACM